MANVMKRVLITTVVNSWLIYHGNTLDMYTVYAYKYTVKNQKVVRKVCYDTIASVFISGRYCLGLQQELQLLLHTSPCAISISRVCPVDTTLPSGCDRERKIYDFTLVNFNLLRVSMSNLLTSRTMGQNAVYARKLSTANKNQLSLKIK